MEKFIIPLLVACTAFSAYRTYLTLKPLRRGTVPQRKQIDEFGAAASFLIACIYMVVWWVLLHHVNIWILLAIDTVTLFTYPKWTWLFVKK